MKSFISVILMAAVLGTVESRALSTRHMKKSPSILEGFQDKLHYYGSLLLK